jgi:hypothetical protein
MRVFVLAASVCALTPLAAPAADPPLAAKFLYAGELARGEQALELATPGDDQAKFGLGVVRFLRAVERMTQSFHNYGMKAVDPNIPFLRLPIAKNPDPDRISHANFRRILDDFNRDIAAAERAFAEVKSDDVTLPLDLAEVKLDLAGDGKSADRLLDLLRRYLGGNPRFLATNPKFRVVFDRADVCWFRGYCHLLMAMTDFMLAFDGTKLFDSLAHLCFANPRTPYAKSTEIPLNDLLDAAKDLRIIEPDRLKRVRRHLLKTCELSVEMWTRILAETDDDHEWLPGPNQTGVLGVKVTPEMIETWLALVKEVMAVLDGKKLIPGLAAVEPGEGVNVKKLLESPPAKIDLFAWPAEGSKPYREKGPMVDLTIWARAERVFGGEFIGFAIWFN